MEPPALRLKSLRLRAGLSMEAIATAAGFKGASSYQRYENVEQTPADLPAHLVKRLLPVLRGRGEPPIEEREVYSLTNELIVVGVDDTDEALPTPNAIAAFDAPPLDPRRYPLDVEVRGTAVGGQGGEFIFNGDVVDRVRRPPGIANLKSVAAIYVVGTSMTPWRAEGSLAYFTDIRPARPGDHVIVELHPTKKFENGVALLKRYVGRSGNRIRLAQYEPKDDNIFVDAAKVKHLYRVFEWEELLGV